MIIIWLVWCPIEPLHGGVSMLPCPFSWMLFAMAGLSEIIRWKYFRIFGRWHNVIFHSHFPIVNELNTYVWSSSNPPLIFVMGSSELIRFSIFAVVDIKKFVYKPSVVNMVPISIIDFCKPSRKRLRIMTIRNI